MVTMFDCGWGLPHQCTSLSIHPLHHCRRLQSISRSDLVLSLFLLGIYMCHNQKLLLWDASPPGLLSPPCTPPSSCVLWKRERLKSRRVNSPRKACLSHYQKCYLDLICQVRCVEQIERRWHFIFLNSFPNSLLWVSSPLGNSPGCWERTEVQWKTKTKTHRAERKRTIESNFSLLLNWAASPDSLVQTWTLSGSNWAFALRPSQLRWFLPSACKAPRGSWCPCCGKCLFLNRDFPCAPL